MRMETMFLTAGKSGEVLAGELIVSKDAQPVPGRFWLPERICIAGGQQPLQWVTLRTGVWEFWLDQDGNGLIRGVRMQTVRPSGTAGSIEQFRYAGTRTWRLGSGFLREAPPRAVLEQRGPLGILVHLLSEQSSFSMVLNADRQVEQIYFLAEGLISSKVNCEYLEAIFWGDMKIDGRCMKGGFWRVAVSEEGYLAVHHDRHPIIDGLHWNVIPVSELAMLYRNLGLEDGLWQGNVSRLTGIMCDEYEQITALLIAPLPVQ